MAPLEWTAQNFCSGSAGLAAAGCGTHRSGVRRLTDPGRPEQIFPPQMRTACKRDSLSRSSTWITCIVMSWTVAKPRVALARWQLLAALGAARSQEPASPRPMLRPAPRSGA